MLEKTIQAAREKISGFLQETGCYQICARCPIYGEDGCCQGCSKLVRGKGCSQPNLSCLTYTCAVLNTHLLRQGRLEAFTNLVYGLPREGYRGCQPRPDNELIQISDPLGDLKS